MRTITEDMLQKFKEHLQEEEKSHLTICKYMCDLRKLTDYLDGREITKVRMIRYKEYLKESGGYKTSSINSFLAAANCLFGYLGWHDLHVKAYRIQKEIFVPENRDLTREEYKRLVRAASQSGKKRIGLILQTICATGIRVSELPALTVESVRRGTAEIYCKGKQRRILMPRSLQVNLLRYIREEGMKSGMVFCTSGGKALDRSYIWREMKQICEIANINKEKVFPHNLRHLFAKCFYSINKDIAKLADMLGHSSIDTTRIYIKTSGFEHRRELEAMDLVDFTEQFT